jgi:hypothetical protein
LPAHCECCSTPSPADWSGVKASTLVSCSWHPKPCPASCRLPFWQPRRQNSVTTTKARLLCLRKLYRYLHERVAELETENAHLKAALGAGHLQHKGEAENCDSGNLCGSVPPADVVPPSEYLGVPPMRGPDDPQRRSTRVIELNIAFLINSSRRCAQKNYDQRLFHTRCGSAQPRSPLPPVASAPGKSWTRWFPKP